MLPAGLGDAGDPWAMSVLSLKWLRLPGAQPIFSSLPKKITKECNHWDLQIFTEQFWIVLELFEVLMFQVL